MRRAGSTNIYDHRGLPLSAGQPAASNLGQTRTKNDEFCTLGAKNLKSVFNLNFEKFFLGRIGIRLFLV